jgi:hypothetical protein
MSGGATAEEMRGAQAQLMTLLPLFEEMKQYIMSVDKPSPVGGEDGLRAQLEEAEQDIRLMTTTVAQLQAENARLRQQVDVSDARRTAAANMVAAMAELRSSLRGMGAAAEEWLALSGEDGGNARPTVAAPLPPAMRGGPSPPVPPAPAAVSLEHEDARAAIKEMIPLFPETQQFLQKTEVNDRSAPKLDAVTPDRSTSGAQEVMQLVPLFAETKQYLRKVETVDKSKPAHDGAVGDARPAQQGGLAKRAPPLPRRSKAEKTTSIAERRKQLEALRQEVQATQFDM